MRANRSINPFGLRMPDEVREKVREEAEKNGRSLNTEILMRLERTLKDDQMQQKAA